MVVREVRPSVYFVGALDWDRRLFDELIPLPDGTSYNAYLVRGSQKTALIDTVDPSMEKVLVENLQSLGVDEIDYVVSNHAEQDHSGSIPRVLELYPSAKVVTNKRCADLLKDLLQIPEERFSVVEDGESLSLGDKTLQFFLAPWVHWPETMLTYLREDKILFTCDLFGSHLATSDLFAKDEARVYAAAKRYFAEIMMPFRKNIQKYLEKVLELDAKVIAPSHGPIYDNPSFILNAYREWVADEVKNEVVVAYVSMHGSTAEIIRYLVDALVERGVGVKQFNLTKTDLGELASALVDAATLVVGSPTVLAGPHPSMVYAAYLVNMLRPKLRFVAVVGSYGWGGRVVEVLKGLLTNLKAEILEPVIIKGYPKEESFRALDELADEILNKHRELKIA